MNPRTRGRGSFYALSVIFLITMACADDTTPDASPSTSGTVASSTTEAAASTLLCTAPTYTVEYPAGWTTNTADQGEACEWFHPEPFDIPENSEAVGIAAHLRYDEVDFDVASEPSNHSEEVLEFERTEIDSRPAARMRTRSKGEGLLDAGVESVTWYVNAASGTFTGATHGVDQPSLGANAHILDDMIRSIRFLPAEGT